MGRLNKRTKVGIASSTMLLSLISGTAYAYWTTSGSGTGSATTGTNVGLTATQDGSVTGLVPGGAAQDVNYTIHNTAGGPQHAATVTIGISGITYTALAGAGTGSTLADHPAGMAAVGCTGSDFTIVAPDALGIDLIVGDTSFTRITAKKSGTIAMTNSGSNQDGCKGTTLALTFTIA